MKKKYLLYGGLPVLAFAILGISTASAHGMFGFGLSQANLDQMSQRQNDMFSQEATLLGISVDDVKAAWAKGESFQQLAADKGRRQDQLKQKMQDFRKQQMANYLKTLVDKGIITQAQADQRTQAISQLSTQGKMGRGMRHGFGMGMWF